MKTGYSVSKEVANPFLVRQRDPGRLRGMWQVFAVLLLLALAMLAYAWLHEQGLGAGYRIEALERSLDELRQREQRLELAATRLSRPDRLAALALEDLGMAPPTLDRMVFLSSEQVSLLEARAAAGSAP